MCICRSCGSLCSDYQEFLRRQIFLADKNSPYGLDDFKAALCFPLQELSTNLGLALTYGALLFAVPYLGISRIGLFFAIAGLIPGLVATGLLFGCNLRIINAVTAGRQESKYLLDASEMLADLGETATLSCGILLISLIPYLLSIRFASGLVQVQWLGVGWMLFYYPVALMVAASTNGFWETLNPLNGLEVIHLHKAVYAKFFSFYLFLSVASGGLAITILVEVLQSISGSSLVALLPIFTLLMMVLGSLIFYANLAIAYSIGRMQFKESR